MWKITRAPNAPRSSYSRAFSALKEANLSFASLEHIDQFVHSQSVPKMPMVLAASQLLVAPADGRSFKRGKDIQGTDGTLLPFSSLAKLNPDPRIFEVAGLYLLIEVSNLSPERGFFATRFIIEPADIVVIDYSNVQNRLRGIRNTRDHKTGLPSATSTMSDEDIREIHFIGSLAEDIFCLSKRVGPSDFFSPNRVVFARPSISAFHEFFVDPITVSFEGGYR